MMLRNANSSHGEIDEVTILSFLYDHLPFHMGDDENLQLVTNSMRFEGLIPK
jgi:hypothetical protein